ncbi:MAG: hypothetical protein WBK91_01255 [Alphaproteobacteria bacterium]
MNNTELLSWIFPDYQNLLDGEINQGLEMPVTYTSQELKDLFRTTAQDIFTKPAAEQCAVDPTSPRVEAAQAFLKDPAKVQEAIITDHQLLTLFSFMAHASSIGREIQVEAIGTRMGGVTSRCALGVKPELFQRYVDEPIKGAKDFFQFVDNDLKRPACTTFVARIFPPSLLK